ncbi:hypothetical protein [Roseimicrobium gellanilyticum]|nr:hypothetical protein [Roseimicrobium gellanilyticum]
MLVTLSKFQLSGTLEEIYTDHGGCSDGGKAMLRLVARLRGLPDNREVYALVSHGWLRLRPQDDFFSENPDYFRQVVLYAPDEKRYAVEYIMPEDVAPWPQALVRGETESEDEMVKMILVALDRSGEWANAA